MFVWIHISLEKKHKTIHFIDVYIVFHFLYCLFTYYLVFFYIVRQFSQIFFFKVFVTKIASNKKNDQNNQFLF